MNIKVNTLVGEFIGLLTLAILVLMPILASAADDTDQPYYEPTYSGYGTSGTITGSGPSSNSGIVTGSGPSSNSGIITGSGPSSNSGIITGSGPSSSNDQNYKGLDNFASFGSVQELVTKIIDIVIKVGTPIALFFIIYAGFLFVTAGGNETKITSAKNTLLWTLVGVAILVGSKIISVMLENTIKGIVG